jgi:hypothetical protein
MSRTSIYIQANDCVNRPAAPRLKSGADRLNLNGPSSARRDFRPASANHPNPKSA